MNLIKSNLSPGNSQGVTLHLKKHHAYEGAENLGQIGLAADFILNERSKSSSFNRIKRDIRRERERWSEGLADHKKEWERRSRREEAEQYARENPDERVSESYQKRYQQAVSRYRRLNSDYMKWKRKSHQQINQICYNVKSAGPLRMQYSPYTSSGRRRVQARCENAQRKYERIDRRRMAEMRESEARVQSLGQRAARMAQVEREGYAERVAEGELYENGFAHSDDLYSPYASAQDAYRQHEFLQQPPQVYPPPMVGSFPPPHGLPLRPPSYPQGFSPNMFGQGVPSYAVPPNFSSFHTTYPGTGATMQRQPAGWFVPPPR